MGQNVIITGANRGIGKALMVDFAKNGWNIWPVIRKCDDEFSDTIDALTKENNIWIRPIFWNGLDDLESVKAAGKEILSQDEHVHALINNAGMAHTKLFLMTSVSEMKDIFDVNYWGSLLFTQVISKKMIGQKYGKIINMASVRGIKPEAGNIAYGTSKAAVIYATKVLAIELGHFGITVNAVAPGMIPTDMIAVKPQKVKDRILEESALHRYGTVKNVVDTVLFLASEKGDFITGQIVGVDGGYAL